MSETTWTFKPYNREVWNKSKTRVMFVGADPNGAKKHKIKDMGEWFRIAPQGRKNLFYTRTKIILDGVLRQRGRTMTVMGTPTFTWPMTSGETAFTGMRGDGFVRLLMN